MNTSTLPREQIDREYALSNKLACWEPVSDKSHIISDAFSLMEAIVRGSTNQGQYYAEPMLLRRLHWWQDDWDNAAVQQWLGTLVEWDEITIEPLARNCYGNGIHPIITIQKKTRFKRWHARPAFTAAQRVAVYARDNGMCVHCGSTENLSIDHIHPWSKGGAHSMDNFQTLCRSCNSSKGARL